MSSVETILYQASGGDSERRSYEGGEGLTIESQDEGYVLAWSAVAHAGEFMRVVSELVAASAVTELLPRTNGRASVSLAEAVDAVASHPEVKVIEVNSDDETFVWTATGPNARGRPDLSCVAIAFSALDPVRVKQFITDTATPQIKGDLTHILESAERLTGSTPSTAA